MFTHYQNIIDLVRDIPTTGLRSADERVGCLDFRNAVRTHMSCGSPTSGRHGSRPSLVHGQTAPMCSSSRSRRSPPRCCPTDLVGGSLVPPGHQLLRIAKGHQPMQTWGRRTYAKAMRSTAPTPVGGNEGPRDPYERPRCDLSVLSMITTLGSMWCSWIDIRRRSYCCIRYICIPVCNAPTLVSIESIVNHRYLSYLHQRRSS